MNKTNQFKIQTPIVTVESDTDNHLVDIASVVLVVVGIYISLKLFKKWIDRF